MVHIGGHAVTHVVSVCYSCTSEENQFWISGQLIDNFDVISDHINHYSHQRLHSGSG